MVRPGESKLGMRPAKDGLCHRCKGKGVVKQGTKQVRCMACMGSGKRGYQTK